MSIFLKRKYTISRNEKDISTILDFVKFCSKRLGIVGDITIVLIGKSDSDIGISTGGYDILTQKIMVREFGRSLVDILRSIAHEMVHQRQHELNKFDIDSDIPDVGGEIEDEANSICGQLVKLYVKSGNHRWLYLY